MHFSFAGCEKLCLEKNIILKRDWKTDAMPLAQFADPWQKVNIKQEQEVSIYNYIF